VFEVKGGEMAGRQQPGDITRWMLETERERKNRGVRFGVLVTKRTGYGTTAAGHWWAWLNVAALADLMGATGHRNASVVRLELSDLLDIFADMGLTADSPSFDRASA
jgi:hypothetical protein